MRISLSLSLSQLTSIQLTPLCDTRFANTCANGVHYGMRLPQTNGILHRQPLAFLFIISHLSLWYVCEMLQIMTRILSCEYVSHQFTFARYMTSVSAAISFAIKWIYRMYGPNTVYVQRIKQIIVYVILSGRSLRYFNHSHPSINL